MNDSNNDRGGYDNDDEKSIINNILPKTVDGLTDRFIERFEEFVRNGKAEHKNELVSLLNELLCKNGITKGQYNLLKHEIKKFLDNTNLIPSIKCVTNEIIESDVAKLCEILKEVKKEIGDDEKFLDVEKLLGVGDFIDNEPVFPMILKEIGVLENLPIPKLKVLRMKILVKDIEKNKYRIFSIFSRLQNER